MLKGINNFAGTEKEVTVYGSQKTDGRIPVSELKITAAAVKAADIEKEADRFDAAVKNCGLKMNNGGKTVTAENYEMIKDTHSEDSCSRAGTCTFILAGKGDTFYGQRTVSVKITGTAISKAKVKETVTYNGEEKYLDGETLKLSVTSGKTVKYLSENKDYVIVPDSYLNNVNAGRASVTAEGRGEYSGSAKISFTILPETGEKKVAVSDAVYAKAFPGSDRNESGRKGV